MIVWINDEKWQVYETDSINIIKKRLAIDRDTSPKYIYLENIKIEEGIRIKMVDLFEELKKIDVSHIKDAYDRFGSIFELAPIEFGQAWLYINKMTQNRNIIEQLSVLDDKFSDSDMVRANVESYIGRLQTEMILLKEHLKIYNDIVPSINKYKSVYTTPFEKGEIVLEITYESSLRLIELFNMFVVDLTLPYVSFSTRPLEKREEHTNTIYKIYDQLKPSFDWIDPRTSKEKHLKNVSEKIIFYVMNIDSNRPYKNISDIYSLGTIIKDKDRFYLRFRFQEGKTLDDTDMLIRIISHLPSEVSNYIHKIDQQEIQIKGSFMIPDIGFDRFIFMDMVTNDRLISKYLYNDEKDKSAVEKTRFYIIFEPEYEPNDQMTVTISEREVSHKEYFDFDKKLKVKMPSGSSYILINISRSKNIEQAQNFVRIISKIFRRYQETREDVVKYYKTFGINLSGIKKKKMFKDEHNLKDLVPDLFVSGYARDCTKSLQPTIISKDEVQRYKNKGWEVMTYPLIDDPIGQTNYYICKNTKTSAGTDAPHPGLKSPTHIEPRDIRYNYIPCCYPKNQMVEGKNSGLREYMVSQDKVEIEKKISGDIDTIITTFKILGPNRFGYLPKHIDDYLNNIHPGTYHRMGVVRSPNSIIHSLLKIFDRNYIPKEKYINTIKNKILKKINLGICKQELYQYSPDSIKERFMSINYIRPLEFVSLFEEYFDCNLYIFYRDDKKFPDGTLEIPPYLQFYTRYKRDYTRPTVLILEHMGSEIDHAEYPQCEIITLDKTPFTGTDVSKKQLEETFIKMTGSLLINIKRTHWKKSLDKMTFDRKINNQIVDMYGKTRGFQFRNIIIYTDPLPPINVPVMTSHVQNNNKWSDIRTFINDEKIIIIKQIVKENRTVGIVGVKNGNKIRIYFEQRDSIGNYPVVIHKFSYEQKSSLKQQENNKRIARYLREYLLYIFSLWIQDKGIIKKQILDELTHNTKTDYMTQFTNDRLIIKEGWEYQLDKIPIKLSTNNHLFTNNKLICSSKELYERLLYTLKLYLSEIPDIIFKYYQNIFVPNYFVDLSDFTKRDNQLLFGDPQSLVMWIQLGKHKHIVYDYIPELNTEPIIFNSPVLNNKTYIIQSVNHGELKRALNVAKYWEEHRINRGYHTPPIKKEIPYKLLSFKTQIDVVIKSVGRTDDNSPLIIAYKDNYVPLLPL